MRKLLTVEDVFLIEGRGVVVLPALPFGSGHSAVDVAAELRQQDGSIFPIEIHIDPEHLNRPQTPGRANWQRVCSLTGIDRSDVQPGSEIWCADELVEDVLDGELG